MERSLPGDHYIRVDDLEPFIRKVEALRLEGLSTRAIADRLGVSVSTMNDRLRKFKKRGVA